MPEAVEYDDDRPGYMRTHVADQRARLAAALYTRDALRLHWEACGLRITSGTKWEAGWVMAQHGLIDAKGRLRAGFPLR